MVDTKVQVTQSNTVQYLNLFKSSACFVEIQQGLRCAVAEIFVSNPEFIFAAETNLESTMNKAFLAYPWTLNNSLPSSVLAAESTFSLPCEVSPDVELVVVAGESWDFAVDVSRELRLPFA